MITINIKEDEENIKIEICDNGSGIPDKVFAKLGEPYVTTKEKNGTDANK